MATSEPLNKWGYHVLIALDQLANALLRGASDETFSSRTYRGAVLAKQPKKRWKVMYRIIEGIFFWEKGKHCKTAFQSELKRKQYPASFRKKEIE
ncbi:hypothetical protein [Pasteurella multocida]|uniref:hypothetical protein n=1 Tax=Pasteurella multocida TaxID=747 RepID=UPI00027B1CAC|nr:hypothetical protein [Pasteurella multocida]APB78624.1 DNA helicase UvrD [Pasteurella multocida]ATC22279.1 DNA helicase UvrD [Pasteurella multocida]EJS83452.1 hypothetical protein KCU_10331 [Pasteurella multocida subsp. multocida str. P52VAC]EPE76247.1 hypothetical protein I010_02205 [Pasteurella multocida 1500C]ERL41332.1 hypothetical protein B654_05926 [Pasteurella multocida subsp. multocida str. PMTB]